MWLAFVLGAQALTLEEAWKSAAGDSQEAVMISESERQSRLMLSQALWSLGPRVAATGNWTLNQREIALDFGGSFPPEVLALIENVTGAPVDFGDPTIIQEKQYLDANISVIQPLLNLRSLPGVVGAKALVRAGEAQSEASLNQLQVGVARVYWGVLLARSAEKIAQDSLALSRQYVHNAKALVDAGSAPPQALLQAQLAEAKAERDLLGAQARRVQSEDLFKALTGLSATGELVRPGLPGLPWSSADEALGRAEKARPELLAANEQSNVADAYRSISRLGWAPTVDGRFTQAWTENTGFSGENSTWMVVVTANWTLWDAGYRVTDNQRTASQAIQARAAATKMVEDTEVAVRAAWSEKERATQALAAAQKEAALGAENLRLTEASHRLGSATALDLEEARIRRDAALLAVDSEEMGLHLATYQLLALGGALR
jgi:outer membrane protein